MKISSHLSQLWLVDIQTKLADAMPAAEMQSVIRNVNVLAQAARFFDVETLASEQYPQGLGETVDSLKSLIKQENIMSKTAFSCVGEPKLANKLHQDFPQIILAGMEAHICVLQTALDLTVLNGAKPKQVFVVEDAVISRKEQHKAYALARMRDAGCIITNTESVLFEWLADAQHPHFKTLSKLIR